MLPESRNIGISRYGYREATASLDAFPLQRASRLLDDGRPELDIYHTKFIRGSSLDSWTLQSH
jgi:hypothetical protein